MPLDIDSMNLDAVFCSDMVSECSPREAFENVDTNAEQGRAYTRVVGGDGKELFNGAMGTPQRRRYTDCLGSLFFAAHLALVFYVTFLALIDGDIQTVRGLYHYLCAARSRIDLFLTHRFLIGNSCAYIYMSPFVCLSICLPSLQADYKKLAIFASYCALFAGIVSIATFNAMVLLRHRWVKSSLSISLSIFLVIAICSAIMPIMDERSLACVTSMVLFFSCTPYVAFNWKRIPVS